MEAATVAPVAGGRRGVLISPTWLAVCFAGAVVGVVGLFLKAFNLPAGLTYEGTNNMWSAVAGGKAVLVFAVVTLVFLFAAIRRHRRGILWGAYIAALLALVFAASAAGAGFHVTTTNGTSIHLDSAIGPIVCTVGCAVMFVSLLIARFTEKRQA